MEIASPQNMGMTTPKREYSDVEDALLSSLAAASCQQYQSSASPEPSSPSTGTQSSSPEPTTEKKPVKKRKSWGQELPTPTTNLPPRKRAKTEAEKEQRRIERVLRNRAAAQSSRERKRKEVEALEDVKNNLAQQNENFKAENNQLAELVRSVQEQNKLLQQEVQQLREQLEGNGIIPKAEMMKMSNSPALELLLTPTSITHDSFSACSPSDMSSPLPMDGTLDPSHLSTPSKSVDIDPFSLTQHTAVMLCSKDLPCQLTGRSTEVQMMFHLLVNWILCLVASANTMVPILQMWTHLMVSNPQALASETARISPLIHLLASLTTRHPLVSRLITLCPTSALLTDATSSVRGFEAGAFSTVLANGQGGSDDEGKDGDPVIACGKYEGNLGKEVYTEGKQRKWKEEDLMGILAGELKKWNEGRLRPSTQPTRGVLKQPSFVVGAA